MNGQLTERGATLNRTCKTAAHYRLFALQGTVPPKPGLLKEPGFAGPGIEVEIWDVPRQALGGFLSLIPSPLGLGTLELEDGSSVHGFICEPAAIPGSREITSFGGWRAYLQSGSRG